MPQKSKKSKPSVAVRQQTEMEEYGFKRQRTMKIVTWVAILAVFFTTFITFGVSSVMAGL